MTLKPHTQHPPHNMTTSDDLHSLSKGVFVIPFQPSSSEAGPSRPSRPLKRVYDETFDRLSAAHEVYERERTDDQLDDIADWLDRCSAPPLLKNTVRISRLPVAIIQSVSESLPPLLTTVLPRIYTLQARDAPDLSAAVRNIAIGFIGDSFLSSRPGGKAGVDEVESWYEKQKDRSPLLLHVQQAQLVSPTVLSELIYILAIHTKVPIRVLLSVSSTTTFLASFSHVEPSLIDIAIMQGGRIRKRGGAVNAILKAGADNKLTPLSISEKLAEEVKSVEEMTGGGAAATLKALKWSLLYHSINSPLAQLSASPQEMEWIQAIVQAVRDTESEHPPGKEMLEIGSIQDLTSTHDAAPRIAILHALSQPSLFIPTETAGDTAPPTPRASAVGVPKPTSARRSRKTAKQSSLEPAPEQAPHSEEVADGGDTKELEVLFNLWKTAGRNVNLWDWLQGFRATMTHDPAHEEDEKDEDKGDENGHEDEGERSAKRQRGNMEEEGETGNNEANADLGGDDEGRQDRLHAAFIRFCEEARMMGLVRARGKGRRVDEVVKGISFA